MPQFYHADHMQRSIFFGRRTARISLEFNMLQASYLKAIVGVRSLLAKEFSAMENDRFTAEMIRVIIVGDSSCKSAHTGHRRLKCVC